MNKITQQLRCISLIGIVCTTQWARADVVAEVNLQFKATLINRSCEVAAGSKNFNVNLKNWVIQNFQKAGDRTQAIPFSIQLANCSAAAVSITFKGEASAVDSTLLALDPQSTATNVAIEILDDTQARINLDHASPVKNVLGQQNPLLNFYANYIVTGTGIRAGSANAAVNFVLNYE